MILLKSVVNIKTLHGEFENNLSYISHLDVYRIPLARVTELITIYINKKHPSGHRPATYDIGSELKKCLTDKWEISVEYSENNGHCYHLKRKP